MHQTRQATDGDRRTWALIAVLIVAVAVAVRLAGLDARSLWLDEAFSALYARLDFDTLVHLRRRGTNPPLYHVLLGIWSGWFGDSEAMLRLPSVLAGAAAVAGCMMLGQSIGDRRVGAIAGAVLAVNSMAIGYSQEARYYAVVELMALITSGALHRFVHTRRRVWIIIYAAAMIAFVWTHMYAWFVLAAHVAAIAWHGARPRGQERFLRHVGVPFAVATLAVVVSFLPWIPILLSQVATVLETYWIARPTVQMPLVLLHSFLVPLASLRWIVVAAGVALTVILLWRRPTTRTTDRRTMSVAPFDWRLLTCWAVVPVLLPAAWSCVAAPIFQIKYALCAQPAWIILLAILMVRRPVIGIGVLTVVTAAWHPWPNRGVEVEDWRHAADLIKRNSTPDEPVYICRDFTYYALDYYFTTEQRPIIPVLGPGDRPSEFGEVMPQPPLMYDHWLNLLNDNPSAWIALSRVHQGPSPTMFDRIADDVQRRGSVERFEVEGDVDVLHWRRTVTGGRTATGG